MTSFSTVTLTPAPVDPTKHVNFTLGMVLGVDDFEQEFSYHSGRDRWLARDLIGAGTVRGLGVSISSDSTEVVVAPGVALTPQGEFVRVPSAQCAVLADWVRANAISAAAALGGVTSGTLTLYVVLRCKPCLTDPVPIPGEPCRTEADAMAPSRVADGFQLDLLLDAPAPTEEPGMRAVLGWLAQIPIVAGAGSVTPSAPEGLITALLDTFGPASPAFSPAGSYPPPPSGLTFGAASVATMYRVALQLYVTDLRDDIADSMVGAAPGAVTADAVPTETGILLAVVHVPVAQVPTPTAGTAWTFPAPPWVDLTPTRPFLLPLDMLKEAWLAAAVATSTSSPAYRVAAAGTVAIKELPTDPDPPGIDPPLLPGLLALADQTSIGDVTVTFPDSAVAGTRYVVKVIPVAAPGSSPLSPVQTSGWPIVTLKSFLTTEPGFILHVSLNTGVEPSLDELLGMQLMVEVNAFVR